MFQIYVSDTPRVKATQGNTNVLFSGPLKITITFSHVR